MTLREQSAERLSPATIFVVEDSPSMRQLLNTVLRRAGYQVVEARDGLEAQELMLAADPIALALVDVNIPQLDGISLVQQLRGLPKTRLIPIVMLTTEVRREFREQARRAGATGWIVKPFHPHELLAVINRLLSR